MQYHTHDALKEFFCLLVLSVKLNLAKKYAVSPECAPNSTYLWQQARINGILFHEFYEYVINELTAVFENKIRTNQGQITRIVVTNPSKIKAMKAKREKMVQKLKKSQKHENTPSTQKLVIAAADRTVFTTNDLFGGKVRITTREERRRNSAKRDSQRSAVVAAAAAAANVNGSDDRKEEGITKDGVPPSLKMKQSRSRLNSKRHRYSRRDTHHSHRHSKRISSTRHREHSHRKKNSMRQSQVQSQAQKKIK